MNDNEEDLRKVYVNESLKILMSEWRYESFRDRKLKGKLSDNYLEVLIIASFHDLVEGRGDRLTHHGELLIYSSEKNARSIDKLNNSSKRLETLTVVLAFLTIVLIIIEIWKL